MEDFINALLSSAADLIQGDSEVRCDLGVSSPNLTKERVGAGHESLYELMIVKRRRLLPLIFEVITWT